MPFGLFAVSERRAEAIGLQHDYIDLAAGVDDGPQAKFDRSLPAPLHLTTGRWVARRPSLTASARDG